MTGSSDSAGIVRQLRGVGLMVTGCGFIIANDAAMKLVVSEVPVTQAIFVRCAIILAVLALLQRRSLLDGIDRHGPWKQQILCALLLASSVTCFVVSIAYLPLAIAVTAVYTGPLFVILLAPVLLQERITRKKVITVTVGFIGAVLVVGPTDGDLSLYIALLLVGALLNAWRDIELRRLTSRATTRSILTVTQITIMTLFILPAAIAWQPISAQISWLLLIAGLGFGVGIYMTVEALRDADASFIIPFKYSGVIWSGIIGMLLWQDVPTGYQMVGAALVVGSGIYLSTAERMQVGTVHE